MFLKQILFLIALAMLCIPAISSALPVNINTGNYDGSYILFGNGYSSGYVRTKDNNFDINAGRYGIQLADQWLNKFYITINDDGSITSDSTRIDINDNQVTFRTKEVIINPGLYKGTINVMGKYHYGLTAETPAIIHIVPDGNGTNDDDLSSAINKPNKLIMADQPNGIKFYVDSNGNVSTNSSRVTTEVNTIIFSNTNPIHIEPGLFQMGYRIHDRSLFGSNTVYLLPEGTGSDDFGSRYKLNFGDQSTGTLFHVDSDGNVDLEVQTIDGIIKVKETTRFQANRSTITFKTIPVTVTPEDGYTGGYAIADKVFYGEQTIDFVPAGPGQMDGGYGAIQYYKIWDHENRISERFVIGETCEETQSEINVGPRTYILSCPNMVPQFACNGFDSPLANGPVKVKKNRVLPVKAIITDEENYLITIQEIIARPVIEIMYSSGDDDNAIDVSEEAYSAGWGDEGNLFEFNTDEQQWQFNLATRNFTAPGTYTIKMLSGDEREYALGSCDASFVIK